MSLPLRHAEIELTVPFHDLDPLDIVWHGNHVRYFEQARSALLQSFDYDYPQMRASGYAWPVVDLQVRYARPLTYQQRIRVRAELMEWEHRLRIRYQVADAASGERLCRGQTIQVAVRIADRETCFASPPILAERLGFALP